MDSSSRNVIADLLSNVLLCGWKDCNAEFFDYELFTLHVDTHAMEDVTIPVMSKEMLKTVKFAKCEWVNCDASFKSKSHLKSHLMSHTQKKMIACPVCGLAFCTKNGFLNHCYRQETPTHIENFHITNYEDDVDEEPEGILTIDEEANPSSYVIIPTQAIISNQNCDLNISSDLSQSTVNNVIMETSSEVVQQIQSFTNSNQNSIQIIPSTADNGCPQILRLPNQNVALLVNLSLANASNDFIQNASPGNIQLSLATTPKADLSAEPSAQIDRKYRCVMCSKSFCTKSLLREHTQKHVRKHRCSKCSYAAPYPARLREHEMYRHNENRDFDCTLCEQKFKTKQSLRRHMLTHNIEDEEQNVCDFCEQSFTNYYSLNRHIRLAHLKEKIIFACHLCKKEYNRGNNLSRHLTNAHQLVPFFEWSKFIYEKQQDGIFRLKQPSGTTQKNDNRNVNS